MTELASESLREMLWRVPLFEGVSEPDLDRLLGMTREVRFPPGGVLVEEGSVGDRAYVLLEGAVEVSKRSGSGEAVLAVRHAGEIFGEMALLGNGRRIATCRAVGQVRALEISEAAFGVLLSCSPDVSRSMMRTILERLQSTQQMLVHAEKLAGLGTMAAGLAHELNNPAAAVRSSAVHLEEAMTAWRTAAAQIARLPLDEDTRAHIETLDQVCSLRASSVYHLSTVERSDLEDGLAAWLEERGSDDAWDVAPALVNCGWDLQSVADALGEVEESAVAAVARWMAAGCTVYGLLRELRSASGQISELVGAVKNYTYLDQAPVQEIKLEETLESTLVMLHHRLKGGIEVVREYGEVPPVMAFGSELNQVWTNLIANAADALGGSGTIWLRTSAADGWATVEIEDNGPGIPPEVQQRIFEPFFTTKGPGSGTGLGLHICHKIVTERHGGRLEVESEPGRTVFRVALPVR